MKVLVVDNRDSFTYNLVQMLREAGAEPDVKFCEEIIPINSIEYKKILISPGPGIPGKDLKAIIKMVSKRSSVLGVCLGLQAIVEVFGGRLKPAAHIYHGESVTTLIKTQNSKLFINVPESFKTGRYHSWVADPESLPKDLSITAEDANGEIMAIEHCRFSVQAVQFHPESILTEHGITIITNWLKALIFNKKAIVLMALHILHNYIIRDWGQQIHFHSAQQLLLRPRNNLGYISNCVSFIETNYSYALSIPSHYTYIFDALSYNHSMSGNNNKFVAINNFNQSYHLTCFISGLNGYYSLTAASGNPVIIYV